MGKRLHPRQVQKRDSRDRGDPHLERAAQRIVVGRCERDADPKNLQTFVQVLVKEAVKELHEQGLAKAIAR